MSLLFSPHALALSHNTKKPLQRREGKGILVSREALLPLVRSRANEGFEGYVTCVLHKGHSIISKMADVGKASPEKTLEAADNFDMPPPCIASKLQEKAKTDNEGLKRKSSMKEKKETTPELPYKVPSWSGVPEDLFSLEVLKNGCIISNIDLTSKPFHVFGRLPNCDVSLEHPSVSRYHAVIQYKTSDSSNSEKGFYIYDLGSTHGTTVNKSRIEPKRYYRLRVGYVFKFGGSSRLFILQVRKDTH